ncbi:MAG: hypothetical protein U5N27_22725 [Rhizobium sp.]|nr:hypothetical protein [Rhizobium sp.]
MAAEHGIVAERLPIDRWADKVTEISGDEVVPDPVEDLVVTLQRRGVVTDRQATLQKVRRIIARTTRLLRRRPHKACGSKIEVIHESLDEADRVVRADVVIHRFRQKQQLRAVCS